MLLENYRVYVFNEADASGPMFQLKGWMLVATALFFLTLVGLNLFFVMGYQGMLWSQARLGASDREIANQKDRFFASGLAIKSLSQDFRAIADITPKLRIMLNLTPGARANAGLADALENRVPQVLALPAPLRKGALRALSRLLDALGEEMLRAETAQQEVVIALGLQKKNLTRVPCIWPVRGEILSEFAWRSDPFGKGREFHNGLDIKSPPGTPVACAAAGTVIYAGWMSGYGWMVDVDHGGGIVTRYGHMSKILAREGQFLSRYDTLGLVGSTGRATGPHLHYEVQVRGDPVNPLNYIIR
jgi:murein DD-endopeptidase MepM/ murein hydrolase activator NlpD